MTRINPTETFRELLNKSNQALYHKWYRNMYMSCYGVAKQEYTTQEAAQLAELASQARYLASRKRYL
ncbi:hypothetical protein VPHD529_0015 [Vibrio phage D529]